MLDFSFNGVSLSSFGGRIIETPAHTIATRDKTFTKIYGQSGDELIDNGSYNNVTFSVEIGFFTFVSHQTAQQLARAIIDWLAPLQNGYYQYRDTENEGYFTQAALVNFDQVQREMRTFLKATLTFNRVPFWYKNSGQTAIVFSNQAIIVNPEIYPSEPIIRLTYTGTAEYVTIRLLIGSEAVNVVMGDAPGYVQYLDGVEKQHYKIQSGQKIYLSSALPPNLVPGENIVSLSSSQVECSIIPNWRRL